MFPLALATFCLVSGGPYALEPLIGTCGITLGIILIVITPIIWALPVALMTAELSTALPEEGGYYIWVKRALGPFPGFMCGWLSWLYSIVDAALYPLLFATYLSKNIEVWTGHPVSNLFQLGTAIAIILIVTGINIRGIKSVGIASTILSIVIVAPFALMLARSGFHIPQLHPVKWSGGALSIGLATVMWNYLGWDNLSTVAGEVENPQKSFPRSLAISITLVTLVYLLPILATIGTSPDQKLWTDGSWPTIAARAAGPWVGSLVLFGGLASVMAMFSSQMLASSRIPAVLAEDGYLPKSLSKVNEKFGTPIRSILLCTVFYTCLSPFKFEDLITANVTLYGLGVLFEFAALVALRKKEPNLERPFRIWGGTTVAAILGLVPALLIVLLFQSSVKEYGWLTQLLTASAIAVGIVIYVVTTRRKPIAITLDSP